MHLCQTHTIILRKNRIFVILKLYYIVNDSEFSYYAYVNKEN